MKAAIFRRPSPKFPNIFGAGHPIPNAQLGKAGGCETTDQTNGRGGKLRNFTERDGAPKFPHNVLESALFWRIRPKFPNISGAGKPPFPTPNLKKLGKYDATEYEKTHRGAPRNATGRLNMAPRPGIRHFGGYLPNTQIFSARATPFATYNWRRRGNTKPPNRRRGPRGAPRNVTGRDATPKLVYRALESAIFRWHPPRIF